VKRIMPGKTTRMTLLAASILAVAAGGAVGHASAAEKSKDGGAVFTPEQQDAIHTMIHDYILENPEVIIEAGDKFQQKQQEEQQKLFQKNVIKYKDFLTSKDTPTGGNPKGSKIVVEFFDYNCGYCKKAVEDIVNVVKDDADVKVYFKDMPILATSSTDASRWALAAGKQGKYYEFHVALMKSSLPRDVTTYKKIAEDLKLDVAKLEKDADGDPEIRDAIEKNLEVARDLGIHGTPAFIINGTSYPGYLGLDMMKKAVATKAPGDDAKTP
jgi:protein-disulfide isomerase